MQSRSAAERALLDVAIQDLEFNIGLADPEFVTGTRGFDELEPSVQCMYLRQFYAAPSTPLPFDDAVAVLRACLDALTRHMRRMFDLELLQGLYSDTAPGQHPFRQRIVAAAVHLGFALPPPPAGFDASEWHELIGGIGRAWALSLL